MLVCYWLGIAHCPCNCVAGAGAVGSHAAERGQVSQIWCLALRDSRWLRGLPWRGARSLLANRGGGALGRRLQLHLEAVLDCSVSARRWVYVARACVCGCCCGCCCGCDSLRDNNFCAFHSSTRAALLLRTEVSIHKLRMPVLANGDCAGRFAATLEVMTYNAISLALSQLTSADRFAPAIASSCCIVRVLNF